MPHIVAMTARDVATDLDDHAVGIDPDLDGLKSSVSKPRPERTLSTVDRCGSRGGPRSSGSPWATIASFEFLAAKSVSSLIPILDVGPGTHLHRLRAVSTLAARPALWHPALREAWERRQSPGGRTPDPVSTGSLVARSLARLLAQIRTDQSLAARTGRAVPGHYAGLMRIGRETIAVTTDTVGTKGLLAQEVGDWEGVGEDIVAVNVNDLASVGARP